MGWGSAGGMGRQTSGKVTAIIQGGDSGTADLSGRSGGGDKQSEPGDNLNMKHRIC